MNATSDNSSVAGELSTSYTFHGVPLEFQFRSPGNPPSSMWNLTVAWGKDWANATSVVGDGCVPTYVPVSAPGGALTVAYAGPYQRTCGCSDDHYYADAYIASGDIE